jgi:AmmeMemoRadiSam system protein B
MTEAIPLIRPEIDAFPTRDGDELFYVLYDRSGTSEAQLAVSPLALFVVSKMDGIRSILDLRTLVEKDVGSEIACEEISSIIRALDEALFLAGGRFEEYVSRLRREFLAHPVRESRSAGSAYCDDPSELARQLAGMMQSAPPPEENPPATDGAPPRGIIIPHIDYLRGAPGYGQAYRYLQACRPPEVVVVLGLCHQPMKNRFAVLDKDFAVPGATVRLAREETADLLSFCASVADFREDAFLHHGEHSVELQAVWLNHIWGDKTCIIPVLAGSVRDFLEKDSASPNAAADPQIDIFNQALHRLSSRKETLFLASADLAHVGPRFGDEKPVDEQLLETVEEADRHYLASVASGDAAVALESLRRHEDRYRVCSISAIHALNLALPGARGHLLGYYQAANPEMLEVVTYAAMVIP